MSKIIINDIVEDEIEEYHHTEYDDLYTRFKDYEVAAFIDGDKYLYVYKGRQIKSQLSNVLINQILEFADPIIQTFTEFESKKTTVDRENNSLLISNNSRLEGYVDNIRIAIPANSKFIIEKIKILENYVKSNNYKNNLNYFLGDLPKIFIKEKIFTLSNTDNQHKILIDIYNNYLLKYLNFYHANNYFLNNSKSVTYPSKQNLNIHSKKMFQTNKNIIKLFTFIKEDHDFYYSDAVYTKLKNLNLHELYEKINIYGFNLENFENYLILKNEQSNKLKINSIIESNTMKYYKLQSIARRIFPNLFNVNHKDNLFDQSNQFALKLLSKKQIDNLLLEYNKTEEYIKNYITSKCSHIPVLINFRKEVRLDSKLSLFHKLKEYLDLYSIKNNKLPNGYIKGKLCGLNVLCPHIYEYYDKLSKSEDDYEIQQYIIKKYSSNDQVDYTYTCRICSEEIGKSEDLEKFVLFVKDKKTNFSVDMNELKIKIIRYVSAITTSYIDMTRIIIDPKLLIFNIVDSIYNYVDNIRVKIEKSKTTADEEKEAKLNIFIIVIIVSYYINIMNTIDISFKVKHGGISVNPANKLKHNMIAGYDVILQQKYNIKHSHISNNSIRDILLQYYKKISSNITPIEATDSNIDILELLKLSRVYKYIIDFNNLYPIVTDKFTHSDYIDLLHKDVTKVQNVSIYTNIQIPPISLNKKTVDIKNLLNKNEFQYASGVQMFKYLMENIFKYTPFANQYDRFYTDETIKSIQDYNEYTTSLLAYESQLVSNNVKLYLKPYAQLIYNSSRHYTPNVKNLNTFWDVNGIRHKFKRFIYANNDITTEAKLGIRPIDIECVICNQSVNKIKIDDNTNKQIKSSLMNDSYIKSFFRYFTFKCPIEPFHKFENNKCVYCEVTQEQILKNDLIFFKKYDDKYKKIRNEKRSLKQTNITILDLQNNYSNDYKKFISTDLSLGLSNKLDSNKLTMLCISFDIKEEEFLKLGLEVNDIVKTRYYKLYNYFNMIVILYNNLKNSYRLLKISDSDMNKFITSARQSNIDLAIFTKLKELPILPINIDYNVSIDKQNIDILLLNAIIENLLFISSENKLHPLIKTFISMLIEKIFKHDKLYMPYDKFKKDLVIESKQNLMSNIDITNYNEDLEDDELDIFSNNTYDFDDEEDGDNLNGEY